MTAYLLLMVFQTNLNKGYLIGALLSLCILGYLLYALIKPEKF